MDIRRNKQEQASETKPAMQIRLMEQPEVRLKFYNL